MPILDCSSCNNEFRAQICKTSLQKQSAFTFHMASKLTLHSYTTLNNTHCSSFWIIGIHPGWPKYTKIEACTVSSSVINAIQYCVWPFDECQQNLTWKILRYDEYNDDYHKFNFQCFVDAVKPSSISSDNSFALVFIKLTKQALRKWVLQYNLL